MEGVQSFTLTPHCLKHLTDLHSVRRHFFFPIDITKHSRKDTLNTFELLVHRFAISIHPSSLPPHKVPKQQSREFHEPTRSTIQPNEYHKPLDTRIDIIGSEAGSGAQREGTEAVAVGEGDAAAGKTVVGRAISAEPKVQYCRTTACG